MTMKAARYPRAAFALSCLALILWVSTFGWSMIRRSTPEPTASRKRLLEEIRHDKVIHAGYVLNAPQAIRDPKSGELSGFYIDLLREIGRRSGARVEFEETTFANTRLALDTHVRVVGGGGFVSIERAVNLSFTDPVIFIGLGYVCRADDRRFNTEEDLRRPGLRIAFAAGSASEEYVKETLPLARAVVLARGELARIALEVTSGRADVGIINQGQALEFERRQPGLRYPTKGKPFHLFASSFTLSQGDEEGVRFLDTAIRTLHTGGFIDELEHKYNPDGLYWTPSRP